MNHIVEVLLGVVLLGGLSETAAAQLNLLTSREAIDVIEAVPDLAKIEKEGSCLSFDGEYGEQPEKFYVQVRYGCGEFAGQLVGNYNIDLRTGQVFEGETKITSSNVEALAKTHLRAATNRMLTESESSCLALTAARSVWNWGAPGVPSATISGRFVIQFRVPFRVREPVTSVSERNFTVDRTMAIVRDDRTGTEIVSQDTVSLRSAMLAQRRPILLSDSEALEVVRQLPEIQEHGRRECSIFHVGGPLSIRDTFVVLESHCTGASEQSQITLAVDPRTGTIRDWKTQRPLTSASAAKIGRELLRQHELDRNNLRDFVKEACGRQ